MENFRLVVPLSRRMIFFAVMGLLISAFVLYGIFFIWTEEIKMEDDSLMPIWFKAVFSVIAVVVVAGFLKYSVGVIIRLIQKRGAMLLTPDGVGDTFAVFSFLALMTSVSVKFIPWEAFASEAETEGTVPLKSSKIGDVRAGKIAKLMLGVSGFSLTIGRINGADFEKLRCGFLAPPQTEE